MFNGKPTRQWLGKDESTSPTATTESIFLTGVIDAHENRDVMSNDIPNAFIQAELKRKPGREKVIMKITGILVDLLVQLDPNLYGDYVVYENGKKVLYMEVLMALYGMLEAALMWYEKF